jgi:hypothetical protein
MLDFASDFNGYLDMPSATVAKAPVSEGTVSIADRRNALILVIRCAQAFAVHVATIDFF